MQACSSHRRLSLFAGLLKPLSALNHFGFLTINRSRPPSDPPGYGPPAPRNPAPLGAARLRPAASRARAGCSPRGKALQRRLPPLAKRHGDAL